MLGAATSQRSSRPLTSRLACACRPRRAGVAGFGQLDPYVEDRLLGVPTDTGDLLPGGLDQLGGHMPGGDDLDVSHRGDAPACLDPVPKLHIRTPAAEMERPVRSVALLRGPPCERARAVLG